MPSQLDEEEERRKRRREKNKVAAARCRNKKKERTEFLQRVSGGGAWGGQGTRVVLQSELVTKACGIEMDLLASVPTAATPRSFPAPQTVRLPQPKTTQGHWPQIPPSHIPGRPEKLGGTKSPL